ncbi:NAD(P)/FAD-dependent oxidoreductase [Halobacteriovorax sp. HLS]|uniref:NAD(P)/FAD-dependent oxidoreductase n=1 Tax=Halobacteriovorax sp. HLS TaxID=2234000 RepID=UPI000FD70492|nr:FAD-dependent oxidoreductase [Halobacteriovorax sp. HLS]
MKKIAVIGAGITGISSCYYLIKKGYDVTLLESSNYFGGHTNTIDISFENKTIPIDTGFLVHNDRTYPNLIDFFNELNINVHPSDMTFSVKRVSENIVWAGTNLLTVFAQLKNLFSYRFYKFLFEVLRFNKNSKRYLDYCTDDLDITLGDLLSRESYSDDFKRWYLLPMGGCIWSTPTDEMLKFPAKTFLVFCMNHGLLQIFNRPQWKTVLGGCRNYVAKALERLDKKYLNVEIKSIESINGKVRIVSNRKIEHFDYCIVCTHPPQALEIVKFANDEIKKNLESFKYQPNKAVVHYDSSILPKNKRAWAAWNYSSVLDKDGADNVSVSYLINKLQPLPTLQPIIVSLNPVDVIDPKKVFKEIQYEHPLFDTHAVSSQKRIDELNGEGGIYFAGAWMRYGFHEDGILSAKKVVRQILKSDNISETIEIL